EDDLEFEEEEIEEKPKKPEPTAAPKAFVTPRTEHLKPTAGNGNGNGHGNGNGNGGAVTALAEKIRVARMKGYEGDPCSECGQLTLIRSGSCCKCDTCGATSGCS